MILPSSVNVRNAVGVIYMHTCCPSSNVESEGKSILRESKPITDRHFCMTGEAFSVYILDTKSNPNKTKATIPSKKNSKHLQSALLQKT